MRTLYAATIAFVPGAQWTEGTSVTVYAEHCTRQEIQKIKNLRFFKIF